MTAYPAPSSSVARPIQIPATFLILALVICTITLMVEAYRVHHGLQKRPPIFLSTMLLLAGTVLYMVGSVTSDASFQAISPLTIVSALLIGVGGALLLLLWTCAYSQLPAENVLQNVAASTLLGGAFVCLTMAVAPILDTTTKALTLLVISSIPLFAIVETNSEGHVAVLDKDRNTKSIIPTYIIKIEDGQRAELALGVLVLYWAVCACSWGDVAAQGAFIGSARNELASSIGTMISAACVLISCWYNSGENSAKLEKQTEFSASFVAAILLFVSWGISQITTGSAFIVGIILGIGQGLALCTSISAVARTSRWVGPIHAISASGALVCILLLILASVAFFHPSTGTGIAVVLNAIYIVLALSWRVSLHFRHNQIKRDYEQH